MSASLPLLAAGTVATCAAMGLLWQRQRRTGRADVVDVAWAAAIATLALGYAVFAQGWAPRRLLAGTLAALWGYRLAWHLHARCRRGAEDGRYQALRAAWGAAADVRMFAFFQLQAAVAVFFSVPFLLAAQDVRVGWSGLELAGALLTLLGVAGEHAADDQLRRFKAAAQDRTRVCDAGWWRYSRHPNYFFEWLTWCGIALFALSAPQGALALACPLLILHFLLRVTGIPATEAQALRTRGETYRRYQARTSAFVPWFPRKGP